MQRVEEQSRSATGERGEFVAAGLSAGPVMTWVTRAPRVALMTAGAA
jgi:hypothetical protein